MFLCFTYLVRVANWASITVSSNVASSGVSADAAIPTTDYYRKITERTFTSATVNCVAKNDAATAQDSS